MPNKMYFLGIVKRGCFYCLVVIICLFAAFPIYWMIVTSLLSKKQLFVGFSLAPFSYFHFDAYVNVFTSTPFPLWLTNTSIVAGCTMIIVVLLATFAAYGFSRYQYRLKNLSIGMILVTQMIPQILLLIPFYVLFANLSLIDHLGALIIGNTAFLLPIVTWIMKSYIDGIPPEIESAAMIDGCSRLNVIFRIVLPLAFPGIAASAIIVFSSSWSEFILARTIINTSSKWVLSIGLSSFSGEVYTFWSEAMATAVVFSAPVIILFLLAQRQIIKGLTAGGVKQ